jgi:hypothetical protein
MNDMVQVSTKDCRKEFGPTADRVRAMSRLVALVLLPAFGFWLVSFSERERKVGFIGFTVCLAIFLIGSFKLPKLTCPCCNNRADHAVEQFCPECGSRSLERENALVFVTRCCSCGKKLVRGKRRRYKIRYCTVCGAYLDEHGI